MSINSPTQNIILVGAGGYGRELVALLLSEPKDLQTWVIKGFLDDNPEKTGSLVSSYPILGTSDTYTPDANDVFLLAVGNPHIRLQLAEKLLKKNAKLFTFIHSKALVLTDAKFGQGCVVYPNSVIANNAQLGDFVSVNYFTAIGHDVTIGNACVINAHCDIPGNVKIGNGVIIGNGSNMVPGIKIGDKAILGAGSTAFRNIPAGKTVLGCPAKAIN